MNKTTDQSQDKSVNVKASSWFKKPWLITILIIAIILLSGGIWWIKCESAPSITKKVLPNQETVISLEKVKLTIPKGAISQKTAISIKKLSAKKAAAAPADSNLSSDIYQFGPEGITFAKDQPALVSLPFNPAGLSENEIDSLYIAYLDSGQWKALTENVINTKDNLISAPILHFSIYGVFNKIKSAIQALGDAAFQDIVEPQSDFSQLPADLQATLKAEYDSSAIKSAIFWKVSHASKTASTTIAVANVVDQLSGLALSALEGGQKAVEKVLAEAIALALGEQIVSKAAGEEVGTLTVVLYETAKVGSKIAEKGFKAIKGAAALQAEIASWILASEMDYINAHVDGGIKSLWTLNLTSIERLRVYWVTVDGNNLKTGLHDRGVKYFYYDPSQNKYVSYFDNTVERKIDISITGASQTSTPSTSQSQSAQPPTTSTATESKESSKGSIAAFAADWSWSKERNQDGKYGETKVTIDLAGKTVTSAKLYLTAGYSQQAGSASGNVYISKTQQVQPTDSNHNKGGYWYGQTISAGSNLGSFSCSYTAGTSEFDITNFLKSNSAGSYYIAVENLDSADIGISNVYLKATVQ